MVYLWFLYVFFVTIEGFVFVTFVAIFVILAYDGNRSRTHVDTEIFIYDRAPSSQYYACGVGKRESYGTWLNVYMWINYMSTMPTYLSVYLVTPSSVANWLQMHVVFTLWTLFLTVTLYAENGMNDAWFFGCLDIGAMCQ